MEMRRKDREMPATFGLEVIDRSSYGTLTVTEPDGMPYCVPLSIVRKQQTLYFHGAQSGHKAGLFAFDPSVCIVFVGHAQVPDIYSEEELAGFHEYPEKAGALISKVFTTEFESTMVRGKVCRVTDREEQIEALRSICLKYTPDKMQHFDLAIHTGLSRTAVYAVEIEEISAKRKKL